MGRAAFPKRVRGGGLGGEGGKEKVGSERRKDVDKKKSIIVEGKGGKTGRGQGGSGQLLARGGDGRGGRRGAGGRK